MTSKKVAYLILIFCIQCFAYGQKIEEESRVSEDIVPKSALRFIIDLELDNNMKWYKEKTSGRNSYECKFKARNEYFSVEFDTLGVIEDVEVLVKKRALTQQQLKRLKNGVLKEFKKIKWVKIQKQYVGTNNELKRLIQEGEESSTPNFEIEIEAKSSNDGWEMYELLLNSSGEILMKRQVQLRPTDNLNY